MVVSSSPSSRGSARQRGVALLIVITVLVTLIMIAVPFVLAMRHGQERTEALSAQERADFEVELLGHHVTDVLRSTHPAVETSLARTALPAGGGGTRALLETAGNPDVDGADEILQIVGEDFRKKLEEAWLLGWLQDPALAQRAKALAGRKLGPMGDDRGSIWSAVVTDAQARVQVNGASPFLLGNLMGAALLAEELDAQAADIAVDNLVTPKVPGLQGFPRSGGALRIGREVVTYNAFDGQMFRGCTRGALATAPLGLNSGPMTHPRGTPVIAYDAYQLALHVICAKPGQWTPFDNLGALRTISEWGGGMGLSAERLQALEPYLTVSARRETGEWLAQQLVLEALPKGAGAQDEVVVRDDRGNPSGSTAYYGPGVIVRISNGLHTAYQVVDVVGDASGGQRDRMLTLAGSVGADDSGIAFEGGKARLEAYAPTPVNINTAPKEVLYAVMANLHLRGTEITPDKLVSPNLAWELAGRIVDERKGPATLVDDPGREGVRTGGPFRHAEDFGRWLEKLKNEHQISTDQRWALYVNAINPHQSNLAFGTAPWCYRTLDVYHVETRVSVADRAGNHLASAARREVVEIGADQSTDWTLDTQEQFEARMCMGSGGKWFATYPYGVQWISKGSTVWTQPPLRAPKHLRENVYPSTEASLNEGGSEDLGDVRLAPARVRLPGVVLEQHFDDTHWTNGFFTETHNAYVQKVKGTLMPAKDDPYPRPFSLSFWWRSYSGADWTAFDCGMSKFTNRYAIYVRPGTADPQDHELVFRVCGATLEHKGAECYVPLRRIAYRPGEWYHIHVSASGEDPATMELLVDGVDVAERRGITYLTGAVGTDATELPVVSTYGFHTRGALLVGREIVEYDLLASEAFREVIRGARGTTAEDWPEGTPVRMVGYSMPVETDIMAGGAHLASALGRYSAVRIDNVDDQTTVNASIGGQTIPVPVHGIAADRTSFTAQAAQGGDPVKPLWGQTLEEALSAFGEKGYAILGSAQGSNQLAPSTGGQQISGWEICYYTRQGSNFQIERYKTTKWQPTAATPYFLVTHQNQTQDDPQFTWPCFLIPISVQTSSGTGQDDYLDPGITEQEEVLKRYTGDGSGRLLLGTATPAGSNECIRYDSIDRSIASPSMLFVQDRHIAQIISTFIGTQRELVGSAPTDPVPDPDPDPPPPPPPDPVPPDTGTPPSGTPMPGGQVPPGLRQPTDPPADEPDPGTEPPDDGDPDPGSGGSDPGSGAGGGAGGLDMPTDPTDPTDTGASENDVTEGPGGGGTASGKEETDPPPGTRRPSPEEPEPDESGGGSSNEPEGEGMPTDIVPPDTKTWNDEPPNPQGGTLWKEPPFSQVRAWTRAYFRGTNNTADLEHEVTGGGDKLSLFLPCFRMWRNFGAPIVRRAGRNDVVTITDGLLEEPHRYEALIRWGDPQSDWVCLDQNLSSYEGVVVRAPEEGARDQRLDGRGRARVLKFPCGELPDELPDEFEIGRGRNNDSGVVTAFLDELFVWRHDTHPLGIVANADGLPADAEEITLAPQAPMITLEGIPGHDRDCGLFSLDGELILYRGTHTEGNNLVLEDCVRGALGTKARFHPTGGYGRFLFDVPVSYLSGGLARDAASIPLTGTENLKKWPTEGLVRILKGDTAELVHYTAKVGTDLLLPGALDADEAVRGRGLFRGRFGSETLDHDDRAPVIWQPFRHWDRYTPRRSEDDQTFGGFHDHPESGFLELSKRIRGAAWQQVRWTEAFEGAARGSDEARRRDDSSEDTFMDVLVAVRLNPTVPWDTSRLIDRRGGEVIGPVALQADPMQSLFVFADAQQAENRLDVESETAELRVFFQFKPNCWAVQDFARAGTNNEIELVNAWKRSPLLQSLTLEYLNRTALRGGRTVLPR